MVLKQKHSARGAMFVFMALLAGCASSPLLAVHASAHGSKGGAAAAKACPPPDLSVVVKYPISGYWVIGNFDWRGWRETLQGNEGGQLVAPRLRKLLGDVAYAQAYHDSTADFYRAARDGVDAARLSTNRDIEL